MSEGQPNPLVALVVHRTLRADPVVLPNVGDMLVNAWVHIALLAGPVLLAARFVRLPVAEEAEPDSPPARIIPYNDTPNTFAYRAEKYVVLISIVTTEETPLRARNSSAIWSRGCREPGASNGV